MLLDVVDQNARAVYSRVVTQHVENHARPRVLVLQVRSVNEYLFVGAVGQIKVLQEYGRFISRVLVQSDFADTEDAGTVEKLGNHGDDFAGQGDILRFLSIDTKPGVVLDSIICSPAWLEAGQLPKVIAKSLDAASIVAGPERWLADGHTSHFGQRDIVVRGPRYHMNMGVNVIHEPMILS